MSTIDMVTLSLRLDVQSDWHIGSGQEGGTRADALVLKDSRGLPYLPGKSLKGLLREAVQIAQDYGWFESQDVVSRLFGDEGQGKNSQGVINVSSACLSTQEQAFFHQHPGAATHLYRVLYSTAIDHISGVAKETSLRSMEVSVPMCLVASVEMHGEACQWAQDVALSAPLITHIGAKRYRGLGQVVVSAKICKEAS